MPKEVYVTDEELAEERKALAGRCERYEVATDAGIRDSVSRETIRKGGIVRLDPQTVLIGQLLRTRLVKPAPAEKPAAKNDKQA
jgi:hypothetical protein